jgi:hydroxyacylglutathione hydrolase
MDKVEHRHGYQNAIHYRAQSDHIAIFDERTGILLTGDTVYPGNLYIRNWETYKASIRRLASFC